MYLIAEILAQVVNIYKWILFIYILMSWIPNLQVSQIGQLFAKVCEPFLEPFRKIIPPIGGVLDISPMVAFLFLWFAQIGIMNLALMFG